MAPGKRPRPFMRTSSRAQLLQSCGYGCPPLSPVAAEVTKFGVGAPERVVVGFDVAGAVDNRKPLLDACESPRSVLESAVLSDDHHRHSPPPPASAPSPRSVLDRLLSGPESRIEEGVGLGFIAFNREEQEVRKTSLDVSGRGNPIEYATPEQLRGDYPQKSAFIESKHTPVSYHANDSIDVDFCDNEVDDDKQLAADVLGSIFCAASPFSHCCSVDALEGNFLSVCFFCKCCLMPGKDTFMYRGDRAFCSLECRYQQIVIDELKERHSAAVNCSNRCSLAID